MIDKTAIVDSNAKISANVKIGAFCFIGEGVEIGENTIVQNHVSIIGNTKIGKKNKIYPFASIGNDPQDLKFKGEKTKLEIGDNNLIREYVTINTGTIGGGGITKIGNNCLVGANTLITEGKEFPDNSMIVGSPGKVKRELTEQEVQMIKLSALHYVENMKRFKSELSIVK